jgi:Aldo/keto reductase family
VDEEKLFAIVDVLEEIANERGKTIPQVALNWVLGRPSVANVVIGARNEQQLLQNIGALSWELAPEEVARLDAVSHETPIYPYWHQKDSTNVFRSQPPGRTTPLFVREIDRQPGEQNIMATYITSSICRSDRLDLDNGPIGLASLCQVS